HHLGDAFLRAQEMLVHVEPALEISEHLLDLKSQAVPAQSLLEVVDVGSQIPRVVIGVVGFPRWQAATGELDLDGRVLDAPDVVQKEILSGTQRDLGKRLPAPLQTGLVIPRLADDPMDLPL